MTLYLLSTLSVRLFFRFRGLAGAAHRTVFNTRIHSLGVLREQTVPNSGKIAFEDLIEAVFERVRADDTSIMRVEDYTTASATILISEEAVLDDIKLACIVTCRLSFHDGSVFVLTLLL